jgi:hypothetical protein
MSANGSATKQHFSRKRPAVNAEYNRRNAPEERSPRGRLSRAPTFRMTTFAPPTSKAVLTALDLLDQTAETLQNFEKPDCPLVTVTVNGNALTVSCNGGRQEILTLHPGGTEGPVLTGRGGYFLPRFHPERWRVLAGVVPMSPRLEGYPFDLCEVAASLGFTVMTSAIQLRVKYSHELKLLRLEHPDGRELWGDRLHRGLPRRAGQRFAHPGRRHRRTQAI